MPELPDYAIREVKKDLRAGKDVKTGQIFAFYGGLWKKAKNSFFPFGNVKQGCLGCFIFFCGAGIDNWASLYDCLAIHSTLVKV